MEILLFLFGIAGDAERGVRGLFKSLFRAERSGPHQRRGDAQADKNYLKLLLQLLLFANLHVGLQSGPAAPLTWWTLRGSVRRRGRREGGRAMEEEEEGGVRERRFCEIVLFFGLN